MANLEEDLSVKRLAKLMVVLALVASSELMVSKAQAQPFRYYGPWVSYYAEPYAYWPSPYYTSFYWGPAYQPSVSYYVSPTYYPTTPIYPAYPVYYPPTYSGWYYTGYGYYYPPNWAGTVRY